MRKALSLLSALPLLLHAQATHQVQAGGGAGTSQTPFYAPMMLNIALGDTVHWVGVGGTHNVFAQLSMFPNNPEGFTSGSPTPSLNYKRKFTVPGTYNYHCTQSNHSMTQHGMIVVAPGSGVGVTDHGVLTSIHLAPNPASDAVYIDLGTHDVRTVELLSSDGRVLRTVPANGMSRLEIGLHDLAPGKYLLRFTGKDGQVTMRPLIRS